MSAASWSLIQCIIINKEPSTAVKIAKKCLLAKIYDHFNQSCSFSVPKKQKKKIEIKTKN